MMFVFSVLDPWIGTTYAVIGSLVGVGMMGIAAIAEYTEEQELSPYTITAQELHHYRLQYDQSKYLPLYATQQGLSGRSDNDMAFFKLDPVEGLKCGLTKIVFKGKVMAKHGHGMITFYDIADIEITLAIPWFIRG